MTPAHTIEVSDALAELNRFDAIIDVRSPSEFAEDHLPGALNWPVLDDEERRVVGTLYKSSPFEARKIGARWWRAISPSIWMPMRRTCPRAGARWCIAGAVASAPAR